MLVLFKILRLTWKKCSFLGEVGISINASKGGTMAYKSVIHVLEVQGFKKKTHHNMGR